MRVVVAGQGYVGLPLAVRAAECGHEVIGYDPDTDRVKRLMAGESYIEDVPGAQLRGVLESGAYEPTDDPGRCAGFDVAVMAVPTPLREGTPDLGDIERSATMLGGLLRPDATVVLESTTYPGTTEELVARILRDASNLVPGENFALGYSPERINPGAGRHGLVNTPKIVSGINDSSLRKVRSFYDSIVDSTVAVSSPKEAELAKLIENTFRHVNIALINEIAVLAHHLDIDVWQALRAAGTKPFGFMGFDPGPGVGGHCLPVDPSYLSWHVRRRLDRRFRFVELANEVNGQMPDHVVQRLVDAMNRRGVAINGTRLLVLGLAYKANVADTRESPALKVIRLLHDLGAEVRVVDPHVALDFEPHPGVRRADLNEDELSRADGVVLLTDHDAFDLDLVTRASRYVFDARGRLSGANVEVL